MRTYCSDLYGPRVDTYDYAIRIKQSSTLSRKDTEMLGSLFTVVLNWNLADETIACVQSLRTAGARPNTIIVVDNNSSDNSVDALCTAFDDDTIDLLPSDRNLGFAGGVNLGISYALRRGAQWVLLVNNDTIVAPTFFEEVSATADRHPSYALLAPLILYHDEPNRIWTLGDRFVPGTMITRRLLRNRTIPETLPEIVPVDSLTACGLLIRQDVFAQIGFFDTRYFMYAEDSDFCWRARQAGFTLACVPKARMWHKVSRSTGPDNPRARRWRINNQIRFYRRAAHGRTLAIMFVFTLLRAGRIILGDLIAGRPALAATTVRAWTAGWFQSVE